MEIFILLYYFEDDGWKPIGAVETEIEAKRYVEEDHRKNRYSYTHTYQKVTVFKTADEAIKHYEKGNHGITRK